MSQIKLGYDGYSSGYTVEKLKNSYLRLKVMCTVE